MPLVSSHVLCVNPSPSQSEGTLALEGHFIPTHTVPVMHATLPRELPEIFHEKELFPFISSTPYIS